MKLNGLLMKLKKLKNFSFKILIYIFFLIFGISINSFACDDIIFSKTQILIMSKNNNKKYKFDVEIADTKQKRKIGLQCKNKLKTFEGMLFIWNEEDYRYFWMKDTKFYLDLIFIDSDLNIVDIFYNAKPFELMTISSNNKAKFVLELQRGIFKNLGLMIGDKIDFKKN